MIDWLTDWPTDWLTDWLIDWLIDWLTDWLIDRSVGLSVGWLIDSLIDSWFGWLVDWLIDWLIHSFIDSLIDRSIEVFLSCNDQNAIRKRNPVLYSLHRFSLWSRWFSYSTPCTLIVASVEGFSISVAFTKSLCLSYLLISTCGPLSKKRQNPNKGCTKPVKWCYYLTYILQVRCIMRSLHSSTRFHKSNFKICNW